MSSKIVSQAPSDASYFFGFHDLSPWSADGQQVVLHRVDPEIRRMPAPDDVAEIVLWTPKTGEVEKVGETTTWNFQQGARAMWLPGKKRTLVFNRRVGDAPGCEVVDMVSQTRRTLPHAIGSISPDGRSAMAPNFARLGRLWAAYGYIGFESASDLVAVPADDGLWRIDLLSGERELVFSIQDIVASSRGAIAASANLFVTHVSFNPAGNRIVFMVRFFSQDIALYSLLFTAKADGSDLRLLGQEKLTHFDWIDDETLVIWMRRGSRGLEAARKSGLLASPFVKPAVNLARKFRGRLKGIVLNESYFTLSVTTAAVQPFMANTLGQDGHPMISPDGRWMIVDEYPDPKGNMPLILVDMQKRERIDLMNFWHNVGSEDSDLKCDLHPRWNHDGTMIGVDASHDGRRCFTVVDVSEYTRATG